MLHSSRRPIAHPNFHAGSLPWKCFIRTGLLCESLGLVSKVSFLLAISVFRPGSWVVFVYTFAAIVLCLFLFLLLFFLGCGIILTVTVWKSNPESFIVRLTIDIHINARSRLLVCPFAHVNELNAQT